MQECPVNIEHVPAIVGMRRSMVMMESAFNEESAILPDIYGNMENNKCAIEQLSESDRAAWAEGTGTKTIPKMSTWKYYSGLDVQAVLMTEQKKLLLPLLN